MNCMDCEGAECVCRYRRDIELLAEACQIFTGGLGSEEGYYPGIGEPETRRAISLMERAGVKAKYMWQWEYERETDRADEKA